MFTRVTREPLSRPPRRVWRNKVCVAGPRCSPPGSVLGRAHIYGYGRSLRPPQGTSIAPRRRAAFRQTLLGNGEGSLERGCRAENKRILAGRGCELNRGGESILGGAAGQGQCRPADQVEE